MSNGRVFSPVQEALEADAVEKGMHRWMSKRKLVCWKCQNTLPRNMGKESLPFLKGGSDRLNSGNAIRKFICFKCVPPEAVK